MTLSLTFHGHSCFSLQADDTTLLFDPFLTGNPVAQVTAEEVAADYIQVSHGHFDHVPDVVAIARRTGATVIGTFEVASWVGGQGVEKVHGMQPEMVMGAPRTGWPKQITMRGACREANDPGAGPSRGPAFPGALQFDPRFAPVVRLDTRGRGSIIRDRHVEEAAVRAEARVRRGPSARRAGPLDMA